jgi:cytochrome b561
MGITLLVMAQLATSQFMTAPGKDRNEDILFEIHEYTGIVTFALVFGFWVYTLLRSRGTRSDLLFPWFSVEARKAVVEDVGNYLRAMSKLKLPKHAERAPLASAIHGLGILLIVAMASTGVMWFTAIKIGEAATGWADGARELHELFSSFVWAYLVGHAGIALVNQFSGRQALSEMWSLRD